MRLTLITISLFLSAIIDATTLGASENMKSAFNELNKLGKSEATILFSYSLSNDCQISSLVIESANPEEIFTDNLVEEIISTGIGPFSEWEPPFTPEFAKNTERESHMIQWASSDDHKFIECFFDGAGNLINAEFVQTNVVPAETASRIEINQTLSSLGSKLYQYRISIESL